MRISSNQILKTSKKDFVDSLVRKFSENEIDNSQIAAWEETYKIFNELSKNKFLIDVIFLFEYEIPLSDGKRPDVLMFVRKKLYIIEFKNRSNYSKDDVYQLSNYEIFFKYYHSESINYEITPVLIYNSNDFHLDNEGTSLIMSKATFLEKWNTINTQISSVESNVLQFQNGIFKPNLDIVNYAESIFIDNYLQGIKSPILDESKGTLNSIKSIIEDSKSNQIHSIIFVLGEAGSGKTALALKLSKQYNGSFISKNGKLVSLLHKRLGHRVNLHSSTSIIKEYFSKRIIETNNVYLIDEAQRVWSKKRIEEYYNETISEHQILLSHLKQEKNWSTTIIFIGIDQQLASSETSYFEKWIEAIEYLEINRKKINIYQPNELDLGIHRFQTYKASELYLHNSIRNNTDGKYSKLINDIIESPSSEHIKKSVQFYIEEGFKLYISRDIEECLEFLNCRNTTSTTLIGTQTESNESFKGQLINYQKAQKVDLNDFYKLNQGITKEFLTKHAITQFQSLGLEFDFPIVQWNYDYLFYKNNWNYDFNKRIAGFGMYYIRNAYRVMLTRGKSGMILYFPENWEFNKTYSYFKSIGFLELNSK